MLNVPVKVVERMDVKPRMRMCRNTHKKRVGGQKIRLGVFQYALHTIAEQYEILHYTIILKLSKI